MSGDEPELADRARARVGTTIGGKYRLDRILGIGGMAAVYAATHRNGHRVALKLLNPELSARADMRARFRREGQAANTVNHPGAVVVTDDDIAEDGSAYLVMELLAGEVVEKIWEKNHHRLATAFVLALGRELCSVLAAAHRVGIVHRDLKPENLFVTTEGKLKVLDFGLAQLRDLARPKDTHTGMVFGTPAFMPPEQARGKTSLIDARTDIWAAGATMFTLLSGRMVHDAETAQDFIVQAATWPARSLVEVLPSVHPALAAVIDRALSFDKDLRWPSADAMREAILATSRTLLGDADVPLLIPVEAPDATFEEQTRIGHLLEPIADTVDDNTQIVSPQVDSSAPPTEPKGKRGAISVALDAPVVLKPAPLPMSSDTPTKEQRQRALEDDDDQPEFATLIRAPEEPEEIATRIRPAIVIEEDTTPRQPRPVAMPPQPVTQPVLHAFRRDLDSTALLPPSAQPRQEKRQFFSTPTTQQPLAQPDVRRSTGVAVATSMIERPSFIPSRAAPTVRMVAKPNIVVLGAVIGAAALVLAAMLGFSRRSRGARRSQVRRSPLHPCSRQVRPPRCRLRRRCPRQSCRQLRRPSFPRPGSQAPSKLRSPPSLRPSHLDLWRTFRQEPCPRSPKAKRRCHRIHTASRPSRSTTQGSSIGNLDVSPSKTRARSVDARGLGPSRRGRADEGRMQRHE